MPIKPGGLAMKVIRCINNFQITVGPAYNEHPAITINCFYQKRTVLIDSDAKKVRLQRVPLVTRMSVWMKLLVARETHCICLKILPQKVGNPIMRPMAYYRPQRSCGQGNVFTGVCLSTGGEGVCLSACWDARPPQPGRPPRPGRHPPGKQTPAYGLRAAGKHPTGMHSCALCMRTGPRTVLNNRKQWILIPVPVSDQYEHFRIVLYFPLGPCTSHDPVPV